jgi:hypothetical protein
VKVQLRNLTVEMPTPSYQRKAASGNDRNRDGRPGIAGVASSGHVSQGIFISRNAVSIYYRFHALHARTQVGALQSLLALSGR